MIIQPSPLFPDQKIVAFTWTGLGNGDSGGEVTWIGFADRSIQVFGTFGQVSIEGSNDGFHWAQLRNAQGDNLIFTTAKIEQVLEVCLYIRPVVTGAGANLSVVMAGRLP